MLTSFNPSRTKKTHLADIAQLLTPFECGFCRQVNATTDFAETIELAIVEAPSYAERHPNYLWLLANMTEQPINAARTR